MQAGIDLLPDWAQQMLGQQIGPARSRVSPYRRPDLAPVLRLGGAQRRHSRCANAYSYRRAAIQSVRTLAAKQSRCATIATFRGLPRHH